ncbi:MAG: 4Fe-4S single cluster domain-containing protein [Tissierellales bacterium]
MEIDRIYYPVKTLGYGERIGIWTIGCPHGCKGCSNPELWGKDYTKNIRVENIIEIIKGLGKKADGITITGGEPFYQSEELNQLINRLNQLGYKDILIYTGYTYDELRSSNNTSINNIISKISALIDGKYKEDLNDNRPLRGSSNQNLIILNESYRHRYVINGEMRAVQNVFYKDGLFSIGIPLKNFREDVNRALKDLGVSGD